MNKVIYNNYTEWIWLKHIKALILTWSSHWQASLGFSFSLELSDLDLNIWKLNY